MTNPITPPASATPRASQTQLADVSLGAVRTTAPTVEHHDEPLGIGEERPRLSWRVTTGARNWVQERYQLAIRRVGGGTARGAEHGDTTGWIDSAEQVLVDWPFAPLAARERVEIRVRVTGEDGVESPWSPATTLETGLLAPRDWDARFITADGPGEPDGPAPLFRREFTVRKDLLSARLYITAQGLYEARINGRRVGDHVLAPGWTSYRHRLHYQTYDVTELLLPGANALGAMLGNGWYRGYLGYWGARALYGDQRALLAQLELRYADGTEQRVVTDADWSWLPGPVLTDDLYRGEHADLRKEPAGWDRAGHDAARWQAADVLDTDPRILTAPDGPPIRRTETLPAVSLSESSSGTTLVDFGQNLVGWVRITASGGPGTEVTVRHAEVLQNGELATRPLRTATSTDTYTLAETGETVLEPRFTFHGFRYAEISGPPGLAIHDVEAVVIGSDLRRTGWFSCSDPLLERLHENVVWSMRGNFLAVPTDCPQRDERLGWTGDIQVFAPTAAFLYDVGGFLASWLRDLSADQGKDGNVPWFVPDLMPTPSPPTAAWSDAATVVPWVLHERYVDRGLLARQLPSMVAWTDCAARETDETGCWRAGFQFGDWLDPAAPADAPSAGRTPPEVVATAYLVRSAELTSLAAETLGELETARRYTELAERTRAAFAREYVTASGRILGDGQTAYALALHFDLLPTPEQRRHAARRLADLVRSGGFRIATGFVGTPLILDALTEAGEAHLAHRLLAQRQAPSWLDPVTRGATTIWERWDSLLPDGSVNPDGMTSFNHYALGAVADWMHRSLAGLAPAAPGYRSLRVRPLPGYLTRASARHLTPYGEAEVAWRLDDGAFHLSVVVPPGCTAEIWLPDDRVPEHVGSGRYSWSVPYPVGAGAQLQRTTSVRSLIDDEPSWTRLVKLLQSIEGVTFADDRALVKLAVPNLDRSVADFVSRLVADLRPGRGVDAAEILAELEEADPHA
ncbi:family 78 glycoside hydrolase catalytic domain [Streptomyces sp. NBC_00576]|uniref:family 78 glycoside hydrolase catalytic domain n=1 Tax=Streptomyces sp. NBC_00576 TaxID=2903665 RepID=UPI002E8143D2|nr:family 78 glycoside hydrolase catalytic domain [Streptomyces sp. NBC_00576]WUB69330.1 glycoside hydrolase family 78 protein [Streptomyces sp. NBC_00576]